MAAIGNSPTQQAFTPAIDYFSGNGSTTAFTLSRPVASVAQVQVTIDNVAQNPSSAFTVSANTITFTSAPLSGTNNIYVYYTSPITQVIAPGQGTVGATALDVYGSSGTGAENLPSGTTAQRPSSPVAGATRYNSTLGFMEYYNGSAWTPVVSQATTYAVSALVVAGGGPGGATNGGGGGAGGVLFQQVFNVSSNVAYTVTVGAGGSASLNGTSSSGSNSVFGSLLAYGGGAGAGSNSTDRIYGGSGSGGKGEAGTAGGAGTLNQGNAGGTGQVSPRQSAGGGGAGAVGQDGNVGGAGGAGTNAYSSWATATSTGASGYYAGGGGGGTESVSRTASGGAGGGGASGNTSAGVAGTANTGGAGGGGSRGSSSSGDYIGGNGGSGIVIIAYQGSQRGTGGTVVSSNGYTYHTFTSSSTYTA